MNNHNDIVLRCEDLLDRMEKTEARMNRSQELIVQISLYVAEVARCTRLIVEKNEDVTPRLERLFDSCNSLCDIIEQLIKRVELLEAHDVERKFQ